MSDKFLEAIEPSLQAAGIRAVTRTQLAVCVLLWGAIQAIAMVVYLSTFETATLHASPVGEVYKVQMTGAAWLHSLPAVILVRAINTVDWLATLAVLSVGVMGMVRRGEKAALMLVLFTLTRPGSRPAAELLTSSPAWRRRGGCKSRRNNCSIGYHRRSMTDAMKARAMQSKTSVGRAVVGIGVAAGCAGQKYARVQPSPSPPA